MKFSIIVIDEGHTKSGADYGATGNGLCESIETRELGRLITTYANALGVTVDKCTVDYANSVGESITKRVAIANQRPHDIIIIIHFNAFGDSSANGCELFILPNSGNNYSSTASYEKNKAYGEAILDVVCKAGGFVKRSDGVKFREDLGMLCSTNDYAVYLEVCFLTNKSDADKYKDNKDKIARAIAEVITDKKLNGSSSNDTGQGAPTTSDLYRVRKSWGDVATQKGAYSNLNNAKEECKKHKGYSVYDSKGIKVYPSSTDATPISSSKYLNLKPHVKSWRVYPLNKSATIGNEIGALAPATYGGLTYKIIEDIGDIKIIDTGNFGRVQIYAPRDYDSSITTIPSY